MSEPQILLIAMDLESGTSTFTRSDGKQMTLATGSPVGFESRVRRIEYSPALHGVLITTTAGDQVALPLVTPANPAAEAGRPVVYLDQNQWSFLARIEGGDSLSNKDEDDAARRIISWVRERRLRLPVSMGHFVEATEWHDDERRYRLGLTLMALSAAWQMRHPLDVERDELLTSLCAFLGRERDSPPVFNCAPEGSTPEHERGAFQLGDDFPNDSRATFEMLTHLSVTFDLLTDSRPIDRQRSTAWREAQQAFSDRLDTLELTSAQKRKHTLAFFLSDIAHAIENAAASVDISPDELTRWLEGPLLHDLPGMPYLGLRFEFLLGKHANRGVRWNDNDLIDMMFLCLAGGYADLVICESSAASHIRQAQKRLGRPETAISKFSAALSFVDLESVRPSPP